MRRRRHTTAFHPDLERFEAKRLLSAGASAGHVVPAGDQHARLDLDPAMTTSSSAQAAVGDTHGTSSLPKHFLAYRITNPDRSPRPPGPALPAGPGPGRPAGPRPGLQRAVRRRDERDGPDIHGRQRFQGPATRASPGRTGSSDNAFPVLTGDQVWKPKTWIVFYVLSKKYYPLSPQVAAGFQLDAGGRSSTLVPGPSGIFLRLTYDPATFAQHARLDRGLWPGCAAGRRRRRSACPTPPSTSSSRRRPTGRISPATSDRPRKSRRGLPGPSRSSGGRGRPVAHRGQELRPGRVRPAGPRPAAARIAISWAG